MIPAIIVFIYLAIVLYIGIFAFRHSKGSGEDFFVASRALGPYVFLLSLFGTTAAMLVPYIVIAVMGGGATLEAVSTVTGPDGLPRHWVSYEAGGAIVA